jgi:hypothetical protein
VYVYGPAEVECDAVASVSLAMGGGTVIGHKRSKKEKAATGGKSAKARGGKASNEAALSKRLDKLTDAIEGIRDAMVADEE